MSEKKKLSGTAAALAVLAGGVIGAGVGLLLAPKSGEHTRKELKDSYDKTVSQAKDLIEQASKGVPEALSSLEANVKAIPAQIETGLHALEETFGTTIEKGRAYMADVGKVLADSAAEGKKKFEEEKTKFASAGK